MAIRTWERDGFRKASNKMRTPDEYGDCLGACKGWEIVIVANGTTKLSATFGSTITASHK